MIVVLGGRHEPVAAGLVAAWPDAGLCSAEDLCAPGWVWHAGGATGTRQWIVQGRAVADSAVSGVFVARSAVHAAELRHTDPRDRSYLAAEVSAFVACLLASTSARVSTPVVDGAFGDASLRPERWMPLAERWGLSPAPVRLARVARSPVPAWQARTLEVVEGACFGPGGERLAASRREGAIAMVAELGLAWARLVFDGAARLRCIGTQTLPGAEARAALGRALLEPAT
jgi:hypothetical protein